MGPIAKRSILIRALENWSEAVLSDMKMVDEILSSKVYVPTHIRVSALAKALESMRGGLDTLKTLMRKSRLPRL